MESERITRTEAFAVGFLVGLATALLTVGYAMAPVLLHAPRWV